MSYGITNPAEEYFKDGLWGWDGSQWRKLGLLFGYYDRWVERQRETNAAAGQNSLQTDAVPAGYIYILDAIVTMNLNKAVTHLKRVVGDGIEVELSIATAVPTATHDTLFPISIVLKPGDYVKVYFLACDAGDDLFLEVWGYKMKIA